MPEPTVRLTLVLPATIYQELHDSRKDGETVTGFILTAVLRELEARSTAELAQQQRQEGE